MSIKRLQTNFGETVLSTIANLAATIQHHDSREHNEQRQSSFLNTGDPDDPHLVLDAMVEVMRTTNDLLNAFMKNGYELSNVNPIFLDDNKTGVWEELEGYKENWSKYDLWLYQDTLYGLDKRFSAEQQKSVVLDFINKEQEKFERLQAKFSGDLSENIKYERTQIPENVRVEVWRRDQGRCSKCESRVNLEYDHIVPVSRGGSNTARNVELLCEACNRSKCDRIQ